MGKNVRDAMTPGVTSANPSQSVADAAQTMKSEHIGSLPVVSDGQLVGMLTDRDIVLRVVAERVDPDSINVGDIVSGDLVTVEPDQDLDEALALMARHQVRRLPVVEGSEPVGILAQADVAVEAREKKAGEMLEEVSQPIVDRARLRNLAPSSRVRPVERHGRDRDSEWTPYAVGDVVLVLLLLLALAVNGAAAREVTEAARRWMT